MYTSASIWNSKVFVAENNLVAIDFGKYLSALVNVFGKLNEKVIVKTIRCEHYYCGGIAVSGYSICSFENKRIFVTGGDHQNWKLFRDAVRLDLVSGQWIKEPGMNHARVQHSSCAFKNAVFVFCGLS